MLTLTLISILPMISPRCNRRPPHHIKFEQRLRRPPCGTSVTPALTLLMYVREWHWRCRRDITGGGAEGECDVAYARARWYVVRLNVWLVVNGPLQCLVEAGGESEGR